MFPVRAGWSAKAPIAALLVLFPVAPAFAQSGIQPRCEEYRDRFRFKPDVVAEQLDPVTCRFTGVTVDVTTRISLSIDRLTLSGPPPTGKLPNVPFTIRVDARGIRYLLPTSLEDKTFEWVYRQQQVPFDVVFHVAYDPAAKRLTARELSLTREDGRYALSAVFEDIDLSKGFDEMMKGAPALRTLSLDLSDRFLINSYLLPQLAKSLGPDPAAGLARAQARLTTALQTAKAQSLSPSSRAALIAYVRDFPQARGPFRLRIDVSGAPLRDREFVGKSATPLTAAAALARLKIDARYEPPR